MEVVLKGRGLYPSQNLGRADLQEGGAAIKHTAVQYSKTVIQKD